MFRTLIRAAERWRYVEVSEFTRRQMVSVRKDLDQEYEAMVSFGKLSTKDGTLAKSSITSRT